VISNLAPTTLSRAKLDGASLREVNPRLIFVLVTWASVRPGLRAPTDLLRLRWGLCPLPGRDGARLRTGASVVDVTTGVWAALGVLAARSRTRRQTGQGDSLEVPPACRHLLDMQYAQLLYAADPAFGRRNGNHSTVSCTPMFQVADGRLLTTVLTTRHWHALCNATGLPLHEDPRFATNSQRCASQDLIEQVFAEVYADQDPRRVDAFAESGGRAMRPGKGLRRSGRRRVPSNSGMLFRLRGWKARASRFACRWSSSLCSA
jgi:crotonobetainyl-CoA:carnitine CoA-transferase CaiB-like acyl-CoA transferase